MRLYPYNETIGFQFWIIPPLKFQSMVLGCDIKNILNLITHRFYVFVSQQGVLYLTI